MTQTFKTKPNKAGFDLSHFTWRADNILMRAVKSESSVAGLIKPEQYDDKNEFGIVVRVGSAVTDIKENDVIFFGKYATEGVRTLGQDYLIIRSEDVKAVLPNGSSN